MASARPGTGRAQLGDDDDDDEVLIAEELAAYRASRAKALAKAELDEVLAAARDGATQKVCLLISVWRAHKVAF